jgi:WD repeat-containing protein 35
MQSAALKVHPMRVKRLYVLAALEVDKFKKLTLEANPMDAAGTMLGTATSAGTKLPQATMAATAAQVGHIDPRSCLLLMMSIVS